MLALDISLCTLGVAVDTRHPLPIPKKKTKKEELETDTQIKLVATASATRESPNARTSIEKRLIVERTFLRPRAG